MLISESIRGKGNYFKSDKTCVIVEMAWQSEIYCHEHAGSPM